MVLDVQIDITVTDAHITTPRAHYQHRGRLPTANITAGRLSRRQCHNQPCCQIPLHGLECGGHGINHLWARQQVALDRIILDRPARQPKGRFYYRCK